MPRTNEKSLTEAEIARLVALLNVSPHMRANAREALRHIDSSEARRMSDDLESARLESIQLRHEAEGIRGEMEKRGLLRSTPGRSRIKTFGDAKALVRALRDHQDEPPKKTIRRTVTVITGWATARILSIDPWKKAGAPPLDAPKDLPDSNAYLTAMTEVDAPRSASDGQ